MQGSRCEILVSLEGVWYCQVSLEDGNAYDVQCTHNVRCTVYEVYCKTYTLPTSRTLYVLTHTYTIRRKLINAYTLPSSRTVYSLRTHPHVHYTVRRTLYVVHCMSYTVHVVHSHHDNKYNLSRITYYVCDMV